MHVVAGAEESSSATNSWYPEVANDQECEKLLIQVLTQTNSTVERAAVNTVGPAQSLVLQSIMHCGLCSETFSQVSRSVVSTAHKLAERLKWWNTSYSCLLGGDEETLKLLSRRSAELLQLIVASIQEYSDYQKDIQQEESKVNVA